MSISYSNRWEQDLALLSTISAFCTLGSHVLTNFPVAQLQLDSFFFKRTLSVHWQVLVSVKGILWGECFGLKICQFDTCLFHLTVCTCVHCQSLCVLRVYVCVYMSVNCIVYFSSMIWPLIVLRKRKHSGSLSIFLPYFFLFNVTMSLPNRLTHFEFSFHRK